MAFAFSRFRRLASVAACLLATGLLATGLLATGLVAADEPTELAGASKVTAIPEVGEG